MNRCRVLALTLLAGLSLGAGAAPLTPEEAAGKRLYRQGLSASGEAIMARVGAADVLLPATSLPCANCHGADGLGRPEGGVRPPPLNWARLTSTYGQQQVNGRSYPAYTESTLATVIEQGRDPGHNRLDPSMPRFVLSMKDQRNLTAYLKRLADERDPGLEAQTLHLGTLLPSQGPLAEEGMTVAAVLNGSVARINQAGGIHGRQLRLTVIDPGPDRASAEQALQQLIEQEQVFALIAPLAPALDSELGMRLEQAGVPLIGALSLLGSMQASPQIFEPLPGLREQLIALADYATASLRVLQGPTLIAYPDDPLQAQAATKTSLDTCRNTAGRKSICKPTTRRRRRCRWARARCFIWAMVAVSGVWQRGCKAPGKCRICSPLRARLRVSCCKCRRDFPGGCFLLIHSCPATGPKPGAWP
jgi:mono/diheme cytochrome c family protein